MERGLVSTDKAQDERQKAKDESGFCPLPFVFVIRVPLLKLILIFINNITHTPDGADNGRVEFFSQMVDMNFDGIAFYIRIP